MSAKNYAIVGTPVADGRNTIRYDGDVPVIEMHDGSEVTLSPDPGLEAVLPAGTLLTVEHIGEIMVEMSKDRAMMADPARCANREAVVKAALSVFEIHGETLSDAEKDALLAATEVQIVFETRFTRADTEVNKRVLVVPADGTLKDKLATLGQGPVDTNTRPPLSYQLDEFLMWRYLKGDMREMLSSFFATPEGQAALGALPDLQAQMLSHIDQKIADRTAFPENDIKEQIMSDRVRAYHRSVGIYATNMCR